MRRNYAIEDTTKESLIKQDITSDMLRRKR